MRIAGGEPLIGLPAMIHYPGYDADEGYQRFPFRTFTMLLVFATIIGTSYPLKYVFESGRWPKEWDIFQCIVNIPEETVTLKDPYDRPPTPSPTAEMAILKQTLQPPHNGQINPALKFSKDDLLTVNGNYYVGGAANGGSAANGQNGNNKGAAPVAPPDVAPKETDALTKNEDEKK